MDEKQLGFTVVLIHAPARAYTAPPCSVLLVFFGRIAYGFRE